MSNTNNENGGSSLLGRMRAQAQTNAQNQQQQNGNQQQQNPLQSRFANRNNTQNNNNQQQTPARRFGNNNNQNNNNSRSRSAPFANNQNLRTWTIQPLQKTVVRFDLKGLGDPFYRLLSHDLNPDYGDSHKVALALQKGGESVDKLTEILNEAWGIYQFTGAFLVYRWNAEAWSGITAPPTKPQSNNDDDDEYAEDDDDNQQQDAAPQKPQFNCLRAIDLTLTLNVLARARTQLLLAKAPIVFSTEYLERSIITDDPRLVDIVRATGYMEEA